MIRQPSQGTGPTGTGPDRAGAAQPAKPAASPTRPAAASPSHSAAKPAGTATTAGTAASPAAGAPPAGPKSSHSVTGPIAPKPGSFSKQQLILGGSIAAAVVLAVALFIWKPWQPSAPRLNSEPLEIARFAASPALTRQPWSMQREYMEVLDEKEEALLEGYKGGSLTDQQYRRALQLGWYGKHLDRMDKFFRLNPVQRALFLDDKVLDKRDVNPGLPKKKDPKKSDELSALNPEEVDRDDSTEEQDIARWPADVRQKWDAYRAAVRERKDFHRERYEKAQAAAKDGKAPAPATTAPGAAGAGAADVD